MQRFAIVLGFPLIFITGLMSASVLKAMKEDYGNKTKEEIIKIENELEIKRKE